MIFFKLYKPVKDDEYEATIKFCEESGGCYTLVDKDEYYEIEDTTPTIAQMRTHKINELCAKSNSLMRKVHSDYTQGEIDTFEQQHQGADDILGGNETTVNAMFVVAILSGRLGHEPSEDEKIEFANRIMSNYNEAAIATANILGKQQNLVNAARSASTKKEIKAIVWED